MLRTMLSASEGRFRVARVLSNLADAGTLQHQEADDIQAVILSHGAVPKELRQRFQAYELEDLFASDLPAKRAKIQSEMKEAARSASAGDAPTALETRWVVEYVEYIMENGE